MVNFVCPNGCFHNLSLRSLQIMETSNGSLMKGTLVCDSRTIEFERLIPEWVSDDLGFVIRSFLMLPEQTVGLSPGS